MMYSRRATQACDQCRLKRRRCDENQPCFCCRVDNLPCQYSNKSHLNKDKVLEAAITHIQQSIGRVEEMSRRLEASQVRIEALEKRITNFSTMTLLSFEEPTKRYSCSATSHRSILLWPTMKNLFTIDGKPDTNIWTIESEEQRSSSIDDELDSRPEYALPLLPHCIRDEASSLAGVCVYCELAQSFSTGAAISSLNTYLKYLHTVYPMVDLLYVEGIFRRLDEHFLLHNSTKQHEGTRTTVMHGRFSRRPRLEADVEHQRAFNFDCVCSSSLQSITDPVPIAMVLLILALGETYAHQMDQTMPSDRGTDVVDSRQCQHTVQGATQSPEQNSGPPSSKPAHLQSQARSTLTQASRSHSVDFGSNIEPTLYPGVVFYTEAAELLGRQADGTGLLHAQLFILAGLYKFRLRRMRESMSWISMASRIVQTLIERHKLMRTFTVGSSDNGREAHEQVRRPFKGATQELIILAAWTCMEIEDEINAHSQLLPTGIKTYEDAIPWPFHIPGEIAYQRLLAKTGPETHTITSHKVLMFFTSQLWLRKRLNIINAQLHGDLRLSIPPEQVRHALREHHNMLTCWRNSLPDMLRWTDDEQETPDHLVASLRARYWEACFAASLPVVDYALHIMPLATSASDVELYAMDATDRPRHGAEVHVFKAIFGMPTTEIWKMSKACVEAAQQSARTINHRQTPPFVATDRDAKNQLARLLVLWAALSSAELRGVCIPPELKALLEQTISFMKERQSMTVADKKDLDVMERMIQCVSQTC